MPVASPGMSLGASGPPACIRTLVDGCTSEADGVARASCLSGGRHRVEHDHGFCDRTPGGAMNTRTIAIAALVIAVIVVLILVL